MIRQSTAADIPQLMELFEHSRSIMRANGNKLQWINGYPQRAVVENDVAEGNSYLIEEAGVIVGTFAFIVGADPTYHTIYSGEWIDDQATYGTLHRLACAPGVHGIAHKCLEWCEQQVGSLRADTHADNTIMQHILERNNFIYCGIIHVADGSERRAYQKLIYHEVDASLRKYIETDIIPRHDHFDAAHQREHILTVIANSMDLSQHYDVDSTMVYVAAAYHDTGVVEGREHHHLVSGKIIRGDAMLKRWLTEAQIETIAEAAEDHRASSGKEPRSIYGKIVAEADRDIASEKIILRTIQYGQKQFPNLGKEAVWERTVAHLQEKYGRRGYMKLWIPESKNRARLEELRQLIEDPSRLRKVFEKLYRQVYGSEK